jgi:hydrogenase maturation protease
MGEPPGTVAIIEPELEPRGGDCGVADDGPAPALDAHSMNPAVVLGMLSSLGGRVDRVLVVGCQPSVIEEGIGLSSPVAAAVDRAVDAVLEALAELCVPNEERSGV